MVRSKNEIQNKVKEIEKIMNEKNLSDEYLEGMLDSLKWVLQKLLTLDVEVYK